MREHKQSLDDINYHLIDNTKNAFFATWNLTHNQSLNVINYIITKKTTTKKQQYHENAFSAIIINPSFNW